MPTPTIRLLKEIIPILWRKKIKFGLERLNPFKNYRNKVSISNGQNSVSNKADIVIFSNIAWNFRLQRPQHLALELSRLGHRVFYIENEFRVAPANRFPVNIKEISPRLFLINLSSTNNYFIYQQLPNHTDIQHVYQSYLHLIDILKIVSPMIIVNHPFWTDIVKLIKQPTFYDCMDLHQAFPHFSNDLVEKESKLIKSSHSVLVTSEFLKKHVQQFSPRKTILLSNACSSDFLNYKNKPKKINLDRIVLGYVGALESWLDTELIETLLKNNRYQLVLAGKVNNSQLNILSKKYPNLQLLGEIPFSDIPKIINSFDICLIPFLITPLIKATDPVKIYEYFAFGKPVLATKIPKLDKLKPLLYFFDKNNLTGQINKITQESAPKFNARIRFAQNNTWLIRAQQLEKIFNTN